MSPIITPVTLADHSTILDLNEQAVPHVNSITIQELTILSEQAFSFKAARVNQQIAGFLLALAPGADYQSPNYRWFSQHYEHFVYVDRIVVVPDYSGLGIGRRLYADLAPAAIGTNASVLTCEVNLRPPNPGSLAFHQKLGFQAVGEQDTDAGQKRVCLMARALNPQ